MVRLCRQYKALRLCWGDASHQEAARSFDLQQSREGSLWACERSSKERSFAGCAMWHITRISSVEMMLSGDPVVLDTAEELPGLPWLSLRKQPFCNHFFRRFLQDPLQTKGVSNESFDWCWLVQATRAFVRILSRKESWRLTGWSFQDQLSFLQSETLVNIGGSSAVGVREMAWCRTLWWHQGNKTWDIGFPPFWSRLSANGPSVASRVDHQIQSLSRLLSTGNGDSNRVWGLWEMCGIGVFDQRCLIPNDPQMRGFMIYLWFHDHLRKMTRCGANDFSLMAGEWNEQLRALRARVANWKASVGSCPQVVCSRGSLPQYGCQHVVSISDARFHPFQQILGRECDEVWMPQRVGFFYPTAVHGGESVNPSPKANVSGFDPSLIYIYIFCWDNK